MTDDYIDELRKMYGDSFKDASRYSTEQVRFKVKLQPGTDFKKTMSDFRALASDLLVKVKLNERRFSIGYTSSQATYESQFGAELWCVQRELFSVTKQSIPRGEWVERIPAQVPDQFKNQIASISLDQRLDPYF